MFLEIWKFCFPEFLQSIFQIKVLVGICNYGKENPDKGSLKWWSSVHYPHSQTQEPWMCRLFILEPDPLHGIVQALLNCQVCA